jgi:UDP-glucose 4-epimerase
MRAFITGGAGFIGSHLADAHIARGDAVTVLDDFSTGRRENIAAHLGNPAFTLVEGSVLDPSAVDPLVAGADVVYHLAAAVGVRRIIEDPLGSLRTNVEGTHVVLESAATHGKKLVIASTSEVYGLSTRLPFREDDVLVIGATSTSRWSYACAKALDEFYALAYAKARGLDVICIRFFNTVGPRQTGRYGMVLPNLVRQALANQPMTVYGTGKQSRCFGYVGVAVDALLKIIERPEASGQVYNLGSSERISIGDLAARIKALSGSSSEIVLIPYEEAYGEGYEDIQHREPDTTKLAELIGFRHAVTLDEIVQSVIAEQRALVA